MTNGKLIVIAGTDCSGKETQTKKLIDRLNIEGYDVATMSFPQYNTPTGKIVGGPCLGKDYICDSYFDNFANVEPKVACHYYAADRLAAKEEMIFELETGTTLILDRYVSANMGHQGGKLDTEFERKEMYDWIHKLEYGLNGIPRPHMTIFLYMPGEYAKVLKQGREEGMDAHERDENHLQNAENAYIELAKIYNWEQVNCVEDGNILTPDEIHEKVYKKVRKLL